MTFVLIITSCIMILGMIMGIMMQMLQKQIAIDIGYL
jgi:hypothetical protein